MLIIVTGAIGIGKTTVCQKLISLARDLGYSVGGILTHKAADEIIVEDIKTGERTTLASTSPDYHGPRTPKYFFNPEGIGCGTKAIASGASSDVLVVDEIGHLELSGEGFGNVIELVEGGKVKNCIVVIRKELLYIFQSQLEVTPLVFEATINTRNHLPREIVSILT